MPGGAANEGPATSDEFDLGHIEVHQVVCTHRVCGCRATVESLYDAEKFRILHICPGKDT
ncbi:hypothetical protein ACH4S8_37685 [Streptomyces sp. NPDC021080]|uniref:hypothetical protein n=1 Tax=Streptomyces sp. NPDC021080 TaxID=3365110 RepID=UPI0037ADC867